MEDGSVCFTELIWSRIFLILKGEVINRNTETLPEDTRETMPKTKSLELLTDVPSKKCRQRAAESFGGSCLDFLFDKKGKWGTWGFGLFRGGLSDYAELTNKCLGEGNWGGTKLGQAERGIKELVLCKTGLVSALVWVSSVPDHHRLSCLIYRLS